MLPVKRALVLLICSASLRAQSSTVHYFSTGNPYPVWVKYSVAKTAGNWLINGANSQAATATTTQTINIFTLPANGYVHDFQVVPTTACAGVTALQFVSAGLTGSATYFVGALTFDLKAVVSNTNLLVPTLAAHGSNTLASTTFTITLSAVAQNISTVTDGCAFDVPVFWSKSR